MFTIFLVEHSESGMITFISGRFMFEVQCRTHRFIPGVQGIQQWIKWTESLRDWRQSVYKQNEANLGIRPLDDLSYREK